MTASAKAKRRSQRVKRRFSASLEVAGKILQAFAVDLSEYGLFLQVRSTIKVNTPVSVRLAIDPNNPIVVQGRVMSVRTDQVQTTGLKAGGIGIELVSPPREYLEFIATTKR